MITTIPKPPKKGNKVAQPLQQSFSPPSGPILVSKREHEAITHLLRENESTLQLLNNLEQSINNLEEQSLTCKNSINSNLNHLIGRIEKIRKRLIEKCDFLEKEKSSQLNEQLKVTRGYQGIVKQVLFLCFPF